MTANARDALLECFHKLVMAGVHPPTLLTFGSEDFKRVARDCECEGALHIVMAHDYGLTTIRPTGDAPKLGDADKPFD